jgi:hypothetical protein
LRIVAVSGIGSSLLPANRPVPRRRTIEGENFSKSKGLSLALVKRFNAIVRSDSRKRALWLDRPHAALKMATMHRFVG